MKKKIIIGAVVTLLVAVLVFMFSFLLGKNVADGKYKVANRETYGDAYIEVVDNKLYIVDFDLNEIYQESQLEAYYKIEENENIELKYGFSEEELAYVSDLNNYFENVGFDLKTVSPTKDSTYEYRYSCYVEDSIFGIFFVYNSWEKTITIVYRDTAVIFEK